MRNFLALLATACVAFFASLPARAELRTRAVEYKHGDVTLEGYVAFDDTLATEKSQRPGVLVCPEWWGVTDYVRLRARKLAELGYVAFVLDPYGKGKVTTDPKQAGEWAGALYANASLMRARATAGLEQLLALPQVDKSKLGVIGYCFGGTLALELARTGADLDAVVPFHAGKLRSLGTPADDKNIKGLITVCHGLADAFVSDEEIAGFHADMKTAGLTYQFLGYSGAVHAFTNPDADKFGIPGIGYNAFADSRSWEHMKLAFAEAFARTQKR